VEFGHVKIGFYNLLVVGLMALVVIVGGKALFNRFKVPGVTDLFNAA